MELIKKEEKKFIIITKKEIIKFIKITLLIK